MAGPRELLIRPGFRRLYLARLSSQAADGVFLASLVGFVLFSPQSAPDAATIAGSLAAVLLPFSLVGPAAGIALDRLSRQRVLLVAALARALLLVGVAALMLAGHRGADLLVLAIVSQSVSRFVLSALSASQPVVVPAVDLVAATSLSTTSGTLATYVGAALGTGVRAAVGTSDRGLAAVAATAVAAYLLAAVAAARIPAEGLGPLERRPWTSASAELRGVATDVAAGAAYLWGQLPARRGLAVVSLARLCYGISFVATILLYRVYFAHGRAAGDLLGLGIVLAAGAVGTLLAAIVTPRAVARWGRRAWVSGVLVAAGVAEVVFGAEYDARLFLAASFVLGFAQQASKICVDALVQASVADAYRGRAFSFYDLSFNVCYVAAAGVGAVLLPDDGKSYAALGLISALYVVAGVGYAVATRREPGALAGGAAGQGSGAGPGPSSPPTAPTTPTTGASSPGATPGLGEGLAAGAGAAGAGGA